MKIILIRHGKVNMTWNGSYDSNSYDEACKEYDEAGLLDFTGRTADIKDYDLYISTLPRTKITAIQMFGDEISERSEVLLDDVRDKAKEDFSGKLIKTELLNEVPKRSYKDTKSSRPRFWWVAMSRTQWFFNNARQYETKKMTRERAKKIADILEERGRDAVLITHEFFLYTLKGELEKRGYLIERSNILRIRNWERIRASKRDMHCGVCSHNCLLTNPGCDVGRDAAKRQGIT